MDELIALAKDYADQELTLRRVKFRILEKADTFGYVEACMIDDPVHFEMAGIRFTPKREVVECADQPTQSEDPSVEAAPDPIEPSTVGYVDIDGFPNKYAGSGSAPNGSDTPEQPTE